MYAKQQAPHLTQEVDGWITFYRSKVRGNSHFEIGEPLHVRVSDIRQVLPSDKRYWGKPVNGGPPYPKMAILRTSDESYNVYGSPTVILSLIAQAQGRSV